LSIDGTMDGGRGIAREERDHIRDVKALHHSAR
jgi:hypothetical protein